MHKLQFGNSESLTKYRKKALLDSKVLNSIPTKEQNTICQDLQQAVYFGFYDPTISKFIQEAIINYCQKDGSR